MTTNNPSFDQPDQIPAGSEVPPVPEIVDVPLVPPVPETAGVPPVLVPPVPGIVGEPAVKEKGTPAAKEKRVFSMAERLLLIAALVIAVLYDRLMVEPLSSVVDDIPKFAGIFWLCCLAVFYVFYWKILARNRVLWYVAGCCVALCIWPFLFGGATLSDEDNAQFYILTYLVLPAVLMAHTQFAAGGYTLKDAGSVAFAWLKGWFIKPFSGIPAFLGAISSLVSGGNRSTAKKAALGVAITLPLIGVLISLLSGADQVFGYYIGQIVGNLYLGSLLGHTIIVIIAFALFYSFLWNIGFAEKEKAVERTALQIDTIIGCIVLGSVTLLYVLFCAVQFTYLFAGAGLPDGLTYSEYAREGFAQTVAVCAINLLIFGIFLQFGGNHRIVAGFLAGLLGLTGIMLISGFIRLKLYIDTYGLTWLRLLSAWFIVYLVAVIILCGIRMLRKSIPAVALCALILLGWYVTLGYSNPDAVITRYNQSYGHVENVSSSAISS